LRLLGAACGISDRDGGAGYVWSASFDEKGVGHLRFLAFDVSALPATQTKVATSSGLQENNAAPSKEPEQEQASPERNEFQRSGQRGPLLINPTELFRFVLGDSPRAFKKL
jgi:hypothetical protein